MELIITEYTHCNLIKITGRIDSYTAPQVNQVLETLIMDGQNNIIIDMQHVTYLSSSGILTFVGVQRQLKQQSKGEIVFANVPKLVYSNFELAGFDTIFKFYNDTPAAVGGFQEVNDVKTRTFPANYKSLAVISQFIVDIAEDAGFSPSDVYAIQTSVDEACSNIIDHAYGAENIGDIQISVEQFANKLKITLIDQGEPFAPDDIPEPDITSPLELRKERGLGIFFMRKLMDTVIFEFSQSKGNILTLEKYKGR